MRKVADALLNPTLSHIMLPSGGEADSNNKSDAVAGDAKSVDSASAASTNTNTTPALTARQQAALLYALAGDQGDSESLLQLGWMLYYGEQGTMLLLFIGNIPHQIA